MEKQQDALLPIPYFMVTFTLPNELHQVARRQQKVVYNILFRTSAEALQQLAQDPRYIGGQIGMIGILHTWGRDLSYHPHVHYLVPAGGLTDDNRMWLSTAHNFLVPVKALSILFRAKFREALRKVDLLEEVDVTMWRKDWVVHSQSVGKGEGALKYLAPYIFRVAISNKRILKVADGQVTFAYRASDTGAVATHDLECQSLFATVFTTCFAERICESPVLWLVQPEQTAFVTRYPIDAWKSAANNQNDGTDKPINCCCLS